MTQQKLHDITPDTSMFGTLTILLIILAIVITSQNIEKDKIESKKSVLNTSTTQPPSSPTPTLSPSPTVIPTFTPTPTPTTFTTTNQPNANNQLNTDFYYPNSTLIAHNNTETIYESTDDPKKITDWYKDKIKNLGMNATSFVHTSTNGNVLNKLAGAKGNKEVRIEISKQSNSTTVKIIVISN